MGDPSWSLINEPPVDLVLLSEGYSLPSEALAATGQVSSALAKRLAAHNTDNDGVFLQLAQDERVVAFRALLLHLHLAVRFILCKPSERIAFTLQRNVVDLTRVSLPTL